MAAPSISFEGVTKRYGAVIALDGVSLRLPGGKTTCLVGPSGCGKTTALKLINRLVDADAGTVRVGDRDVCNEDAIQLRRMIGYVVQRGGLMPHLSVFENVSLLASVVGQADSAIETRVDEVMSLVQMPKDRFGARYPRELSGGQRQRIGIARALMLDPPILLMDEPFSAVDPITRRGLHEEFLRITDAIEKTTVIVTHDMREACLLADQIVCINDGRIEQIATPEVLQGSPASDFVARLMEGIA